MQTFVYKAKFERGERRGVVWVSRMYPRRSPKAET